MVLISLPSYDGRMATLFLLPPPLRHRIRHCSVSPIYFLDKYLFRENIYSISSRTSDVSGAYLDSGYEGAI